MINETHNNSDLQEFSCKSEDGYSKTYYYLGKLTSRN